MVPGAGALAAAVPGAVDAWLWLLREHGTWELADVLPTPSTTPRHGHPASRQLCSVIDLRGGAVPRRLADVGGAVAPGRPRPGARRARAQPGPCTTRSTGCARARRCGRQGATRAERIQAASHAWRRGFVARRRIAASVRYPHRHSTGGLHHAACHHRPPTSPRSGSTTERPLTLDFRGTIVAKAGRTGPRARSLLQALAILDHLPESGWTRRPRSAPTRSSRRSSWRWPTATPTTATCRGPLDGAALDRLRHRPGGADRRGAPRRSTGPARSPACTPYRPPLRRDRRRAGEPPATGEPTVARTGETRGDTCHLDVVDRWGNMVSVTPSGGWLQSSPPSPRSGSASARGCR